MCSMATTAHAPNKRVHSISKSCKTLCMAKQECWRTPSRTRSARHSPGATSTNADAPDQPHMITVKQAAPRSCSSSYSRTHSRVSSPMRLQRQGLKPQKQCSCVGAVYIYANQLVSKRFSNISKKVIKMMLERLPQKHRKTSKTFKNDANKQTKT